MLKKTEPTIGELHLMQRNRLTETHSGLLEHLIEKNSHKQEKYWILGTVKVKRKNRQTEIRPILKAYNFQPPLTKESYLYEIDPIQGTRKLLWVMHPNNKLSIPSLGKFIHVSGESGDIMPPVFTGV